jgi:hypothetical protein
MRVTWVKRFFLKLSLRWHKHDEKRHLLHWLPYAIHLQTPKSDRQPFKTTMNSQNICMHNLLTRMSLAGTGDEMLMAWIERFFLKTSSLWRKQDKSQPYCAAYQAGFVTLPTVRLSQRPGTIQAEHQKHMYSQHFNQDGFITKPILFRML